MSDGGSHNFEALREHILGLSAAKDFDAAVGEWGLIRVEVYAGHCPCGIHIMEHCFLSNRITGAETHVGNVCVRRFMGMDCTSLFDGLRRIRGGLDRSCAQ